MYLIIVIISGAPLVLFLRYYMFKSSDLESTYRTGKFRCNIICSGGLLRLTKVRTVVIYWLVGSFVFSS